MPAPRPPPNAMTLIEVVAHEHHLPVEDLMSMDQMRHIVTARREAWRRLRAEQRPEGGAVYTLARIASWWGCGRTAVYNAVSA